MILLILPTQYEFNILQFIMPEKLNGKVVIQSPGMGKLRTLGCLYESLHKFGSLEWVILAGYAGSLNEKELPAGKKVQAEFFREGDFDAGDFESDAEHEIPKCGEPGPTIFDFDWKIVPFISQDKFLKTDPYGYFDACATDMESFAVAKFCKAHAIPYSVVKVISDIVGNTSEDYFKKMAVELADKMNEQITLALMAVGDVIYGPSPVILKTEISEDWEDD
jgi:nucleoside phosphorylase